MASRAVSLWLAASYSCESFLLCLQKQVSVYGVPAKILSDQGSQLVSSAKELKEWEAFSEGVRQQGVIWSFTPTACPWRNGQAERAIGMAKNCLKRQVERHELLDFVELETVLMRVGSIVNRRPLTARIYDDGEFFPVCPADLLHGRMTGFSFRESGANEEVAWPEKAARIQKFVEIWWKRWEEAAFLLFTPRKKWALQTRNLEEGDVVLLRSEGKLGPGVFRLALVERVHPDEDGVVRTVSLTMRDRRRRAGPPQTTSTKMAVQRLVVLLPVGERWQGAVSGV